MFADFGFENVVGTFNITAGIDYRKLLAVPFALAVVAVSRNSGDRIYDGFAPLDHPVE